MNWKNIMAGGLSVGEVVSACKLSGWVIQLADTHTEHFVRLIVKWTRPFRSALLAFLVLAL